MSVIWAGPELARNKDSALAGWNDFVGTINLFHYLNTYMSRFVGLFCVFTLLVVFSFYESYESTEDPSNQPDGVMGSQEASLDPQDSLVAPQDPFGSLNITLLTPFDPYDHLYCLTSHWHGGPIKYNRRSYWDPVVPPPGALWVHPFCTLYRWSSVKAYHTAHFISRTYPGQFGLFILPGSFSGCVFVWDTAKDQTLWLLEALRNYYPFPFSSPQTLAQLLQMKDV